MGLLKDKIHQRIIVKKKELDESRPLPPMIVRKLKEQMQIEYTYNSNALEGNTLSARETQLVIQEGITVQGKSLREHLEVKNHPEAMLFVENLSRREIEEKDVLETHRIIFEGIDDNAGTYRKGQVRIAGADFIPPPPEEIRSRITDLSDWLHENVEELRSIEIAAVFHHRFEQIHPFSEGNGRVGRLLMNCILLKHGYPFVVVLKDDRKKYYKALHDGDHGNLMPVVNFTARCVERSLNLYLTAIGKRKQVSILEASKDSRYDQKYLSLLATKGTLDAYKIGRNYFTTVEALREYTQNSSQSSKKKPHDEESGKT